MGHPEGNLPVDEDEIEPRPKLSIFRVTIALLLAVAMIGGTAAFVQHKLRNSGNARLSVTWFAPYVDTTLSPISAFQDPAVDPARQVVLGFVVAQPKSGCTPSWGGYYNLDQAAQSLNLDSRIAEVRSRGGNVIVSFGGQANSELATTCSSVSKLTLAYSQVISRYGITTLDFDIEGTALDNTAAIERRAAALATLQRQAKAKGKTLNVWLTLPVTTDGLAPDALSLVTSTLKAGVQVAGVNVMAMDFGTSQRNMGTAVLNALTATHGQLDAVYHRFGLGADPATAWNRMGVTVMIGQNDTAGENFTVGNARTLVTFARAHHLRRISMWSLNRDSQCGSSFAVVGVHSNTCSGTNQAPLQFAKTFAGFAGSVSAATGTETATAAAPVADNPATSPYPIWQPNRPYVTNYRVVREGNIYQAKWFSQGNDPAAQVQYAYQTPWQLIGPVLPGDHAPTTTTLPAGTDPAWSPDNGYQTGQKVLYQGLPYQAKWYNKATSPGEENADPESSPWQPLFTIPGEPVGS
jgi:chitinase